MVCAEIYAARLPYHDIENRTYHYVLYEYLSANLPTLKTPHLGKNYTSTHAPRADVCRTILVSSNESRFVKRVSPR